MAGPRGLTAPKRSFRQQKKQTRLQFSPLPSSSPASGRYSYAVQDRLSDGTHEGAKGSPQPTDGLSPDPISLLSPEPSSEIRGGIEGIVDLYSHRSHPLTELRTDSNGPTYFFSVLTHSRSCQAHAIVR